MFKDINQETGFTSCNNKSEYKKGGNFLDQLRMKTTSAAFVVAAFKSITTFTFV